MAENWKLTEHATARAAERLPGLDIPMLLSLARRPNSNQLKRIRRDCPGAAQLYMKGYNGRYFLIAQNRYVFVIEPPHTVIICWDWYAAQRLELWELDRLERRKIRNGAVTLNEKEFFGLLNLARNSPSFKD